MTREKTQKETLEEWAALNMTDARKTSWLDSTKKRLRLEFHGAFDGETRTYIDGHFAVSGWAKLKGKGLEEGDDKGFVDLMEHQTYGGWLQMTGFLPDGSWSEQGFLMPAHVKLDVTRRFVWSESDAEEEVDARPVRGGDRSSSTALLAPEIGRGDLDLAYKQKCLDFAAQEGYRTSSQPFDHDGRTETLVVFTDFGFSPSMRKRVVEAVGNMRIAYRRVFDLGTAHAFAQRFGGYE